MAIQITQINPRITLITDEISSLSSTAIGFFINSGSRFEKEQQQGITHLTEHMFFKGTKEMPAKDLSRKVESLGAMIDGFTSKEISGIYFHFLSDNFDKIFDLFFYLMHNVSFEEQELIKEKNVVLQELNEGFENPQEYVYTLFSEIMFPNHPLSYPVIGTKETINQLTADDLRNQHHYNWLNCRLCISIAGKVQHSAVVDKLYKMNLKYIRKDYLAAPNPPPTNVERALIFQSRPELKQVHTIAGFLTIPMKDERRYALIVLNNIIGGMASSRANQRLREKEGLLHTIFSFLDFYSDIGLWCIYHISEIKNREQSLMIAMEELAKLKKYGITKQEFERSVNYSKGMLALSTEDLISRIISNAQKFFFLGRPIPIEESIASFDNLTFDYVNSLVDMFQLEQYSGAIVGPIKITDLGRIGIAPDIIIEKKA